MVDDPTPPFAPTNANTCPTGSVSGIVIEVGDALHQRHRIDRRDEIFGNAPLQQLAIEMHIVMAPDDDDLRPGIAAFRETIEFRNQLTALERAVDDDQIGRRTVDIVRDCSGDAAHVHADVRLR